MKEEIPPPAEAATEVGIDDAPETIGSILLIGVVVVLVVLVASFLAGYFS